MFPKHPFSTPWKHQKTVRFSNVFRGYKKGALGTNVLKTHYLLLMWSASLRVKSPSFWLRSSATSSFKLCIWTIEERNNWLYFKFPQAIYDKTKDAVGNLTFKCQLFFNCTKTDPISIDSCHFPIWILSNFC